MSLDQIKGASAHTEHYKSKKHKNNRIEPEIKGGKNTLWLKQTYRPVNNNKKNAEQQH